MASDIPQDFAAKVFRARPANDLPARPDYNICPTQPVGVVTTDPERRLRPMRWGFIPSWYKAPNDGPLLINARAETIAEKPAFGEAARQRRCLVPVSGFYEWDRSGGAKRPWYFHRADGRPLVLAGIWQDWGPERAPSFAVVTTSANALMAKIHDRVPVVIEEADWGLWLGEAGHGAARLMHPPAEDVLAGHPVSPAVNSNRAEGAELIEPWDGAV